MSTLKVTVCPRKFTSQPGMIRTAPSRMPGYQSGWEAEEMASGVYGPYSQTGLICANVDSRTRAPKMKKNQACPLSRKYGQNGCPTTFCSVRPRPGRWVCFWCTMMNRWAVIRARMRPGIGSTWRMYIRGTTESPGNAPPNRKNDTQVPTIGIPCKVDWYACDIEMPSSLTYEPW
jgi:hypothetical protein